jgi:tRNA (cmo5U34)-methyltransferase
MTVAELFDRAAQRYDQSRRLLVPCFDELYGPALQLLPPDHDRPLRVLDLGAGTGLLSAFIAETYPQAHVTLIDLAADMLAKAAERLRPHADRIDIRVMDMAQLPDLGTFDVVVSALAIHHLDDPAKQRLFAGVYRALVVGGRFINIEQILGPTPSIEQVYEQVWLTTVRARGVGADDLSAAIERMRQDRAAPLYSQLRWLELAGFQEVNCWYQWYRFAVYSGDKLVIQPASSPAR